MTDRELPMQPIHTDDHGTVRFVANNIVRKLYDHSLAHGYGMNEICLDNFTAQERMQFAQLIGYSIGGYAELSYVTDESYYAAVDKAGL